MQFKKLITAIVVLLTLTVSAQEEFNTLYDSKTNVETNTISKINFTTDGVFEIKIGGEEYNFRLASEIIERGEGENRYWCFLLEDRVKNVKVVKYKYFYEDKGVVLFFSAKEYVILRKNEKLN